MSHGGANSSSLMPQHSADLAAEMSSHLTSALASDLSYSQMNDAKLRGISAMVGWDQFHGMVLTAHLAPVNLRTDPLDDISKGIARNKKIEQSRTRQANNYALDATATNRHLSEEEQKRNDNFLREFDLRPPTNAHEFARDWKRIGSTTDADSNEVLSQRYRYLLSLHLDSPASSAMILKGGVPLEMIGGIISVVHARWTAAVPSLPPPSDVYHLSSLLMSLTAMSSFAISVFSLTASDRSKAKDIFDIIDQVRQTEEYNAWAEPKQPTSAAAPPADADTTSTSSHTDSTPAATSSAPTPAPAAVSYPMLLPGWPVGVGESSALAASRPARDEAADSHTHTVSNAINTSAKKAPAVFQLTTEVVEEMRKKYKVTK